MIPQISSMIVISLNEIFFARKGIKIHIISLKSKITEMKNNIISFYSFKPIVKHKIIMINRPVTISNNVFMPPMGQVSEMINVSNVGLIPDIGITSLKQVFMNFFY